MFWRFARTGIALGAVLAQACGSGESVAGLGPNHTGSLALDIEGLPPGTAGAVIVSGIQGFQKNLTTGQTLAGLTPGSYGIVASEITVDGDRYTPAPATQSVAVVPGAAPANAKVAYQLGTGRLTVSVGGLPDGVPAAVEVTGPAGYARTVVGAETLTGLTPGTYTIQSPTQTVGGDLYEAEAMSQDIEVAATPGNSGHLTVSYAVSSGGLTITVSGLPAGVNAAIGVTGPHAFQAAVTSTSTLTGLKPGNYSIVAANVSAGGLLFLPTPTDQSVSVSKSLVPVVRTVNYTQAVGALSVTLSGLPGSLPGGVTVSGPGGYQQSLSASQTLGGLVPGTYTVSAVDVSSGGATYTPAPLSQTVPVAYGTTASAAVTYAVVSGSLQLTVSGLPGGASADINVTGPGGFTQHLTGGQTLTGLVPGGYTIAGGTVSSGGFSYLPAPVSQTSTVTSGTTATGAVVYAASTGGLNLTIGGLPGGVPASVTVTGPGGFSQSLTASQTLSLAPGTYTVSALAVSSGGTTYAPAPVSQNVSVVFGSTASAGVTYAVVSGTLQLNVSGLPGGASADVNVTGPGGFSRHLTGTQTLTGLVPGSYTISAGTVSTGGGSYAPSPASQSKTVTSGVTVTGAVVYAASAGSLALTIGGLPGGVLANVSVTGPGGYSQSLTASQTLTGLVPGSYTVTGAAVLSGGTTYTPSPAVQAVSVSAGATAPAAVSYSGAVAGLNLSIAGVYLTQATQKPDGSVPLVAGRDAYVRVFALANQSNSVQPQVRVRLYSGAALIQTYSIPAPASGVPTTVDESSLTRSWNVLVPAALVQPNLKVLADVDPTSATPESDESDNQFPVSGVAGSVDVRTLPTFQVRFVPVLQQVNSLQGNVTAGNMSSFMVDLLQQLPVGASSADVRAPYTTTAPVLQSNNGNGAWGTILSEMLAVRTGDVSTRYYYGVVKTTYGSGVAGMGYVGGSARAAIGWDYLPSGNHVMAHEVGHNMGRQHAPCGGVAGPDPGFPYAGGKIGMWGLDVSTLTLKDPVTFADLMGYCSPVWVSDYNWSAMVNYRQGGPNNAPMANDNLPGLLVWGRITETGVVLEPAFRVPSAAGRSPAPGANRLDLLAADGSLIRTLRFAAEEVADLPTGTEQHFAFVIPLDATLERDLSGLRVSTGVRTVGRLASAASSDPAPALTRANSQQVDVQWDATRYPMVMVRDAGTGDILSFARGGSARLWTRGTNFVLQFSDGVKSVVRQGRILQ